MKNSMIVLLIKSIIVEKEHFSIKQNNETTESCVIIIITNKNINLKKYRIFQNVQSSFFKATQGFFFIVICRVFITAPNSSNSMN